MKVKKLKKICSELTYLKAKFFQEVPNCIFTFILRGTFLLGKFGSERVISIDAAVVFVKKTSLLFRLAQVILTLTSLALLRKIQNYILLPKLF